ncbi:MAG: holo-ACP synthase [Gemmatimonadota bacterium]|nr:holo-ACP synthase [Gemmatimonadota bacterium]
MIVGIGMDLVDIARVTRLIAAKGDRALSRLFTSGEVAYAMERADPFRHLAARIAAKEATFKALSGSDRARGIGWREMEVVPAGDGKPQLALHGSARDRAQELKLSRCWLTLTHAELLAGAFVVLECDEPAVRFLG